MEDTPLIDAHAHVWDRTCRMVPGARYHPDYEATIDTYLRLLDDHGIEKAALVQPSFLGTDNSYLVQILQQAVALRTLTFRGVAVVGQNTRLQDLEKLGDQVGAEG